MSETLSMHLKADIIGIKDLKNRKGFGNMLMSSINAFRESKTEILPETVDLSAYDIVYVGTPTWANKPSPAIITLIDNCNWRGKDVVLFTTMTRSGGESTLERLEEKIRMRGGRIIEGIMLKTKDKSPEEIINDTETLIEMYDLKMYSGV